MRSLINLTVSLPHIRHPLRAFMELFGPSTNAWLMVRHDTTWNSAWRSPADKIHPAEVCRANFLIESISSAFIEVGLLLNTVQGSACCVELWDSTITRIPTYRQQNLSTILSKRQSRSRAIFLLGRVNLTSGSLSLVIRAVAAASCRTENRSPKYSHTLQACVRV